MAGAVENLKPVELTKDDLLSANIKRELQSTNIYHCTIENVIYVPQNDLNDHQPATTLFFEGDAAFLGSLKEIKNKPEPAYPEQPWTAEQREATDKEQTEYLDALYRRFQYEANKQMRDNYGTQFDIDLHTGTILPETSHEQKQETINTWIGKLKVVSFKTFTSNVQGSEIIRGFAGLYDDGPVTITLNQTIHEFSPMGFLMNTGETSFSGVCKQN